MVKSTPYGRTDEPQRRETGDDAGEIQFFEGSITKVTTDGETVLSDHLAPGEQLRRDVTDRYATAKSEDTRTDKTTTSRTEKADKDKA